MPKVGMEPLRRAQLVDATAESIFRHGLAETTISKISRLAGVSSGIISHYFGGKNELLEATMRKILIDLKAAVGQKTRAVEAPRDKILAIIEGNFSPHQVAPRSVTSWLAFWSESMHMAPLARLQRVNKRRLHSNLSYWYGQLMVHDEAVVAAEGMAALIDGLWLRGAFEENGIDAVKAKNIAVGYLNRQLGNIKF